MVDYLRDPEAIYRQSFQIIESEAGLGQLPADIVPIARRMIHACGMTDLVQDLAFSDAAGASGRQAIRDGAPIICDVAMTAAGIIRRHLTTGHPILTGLEQPETDRIAQENATTRSAAGMDALADRFCGAVLVVGNAPTALFRVLELVDDGARRPAVVLGFPVGFVGAAESKQALADSDLPFITLHGRRGGSAIAAAAVNALLIGETA